MSEGFPTPKDAPNEDEWADGNMAGETAVVLVLAAFASWLKRKRP